ncbi:MAG: 3TM-type holin [Alphaproteobacteria bacterium]
MIQSILATVGLPILVEFIKSALTKIDSPITRGAAEALDKVDDALKSGAIPTEQIAEANRHIEELTKLESKNSRLTLSEINQTIRAEVESQDKFVRRMRPTFGYLMALTWAAQMFGIAYIIIFDTARAGVVMAAMSSLTAIWSIGLSVLGIYVYKRSEDKKLNGDKEVIFWNK